MNDNGEGEATYWWRAISGSNYTFASICECGNVKCLIKVCKQKRTLSIGKADSMNCREILQIIRDSHQFNENLEWNIQVVCLRHGLDRWVWESAPEKKGKRERKRKVGRRSATRTECCG